MTIFVFDLVERQRDFLGEQGLAQADGLAKTLAASSTSWVLASDIEGLNEVLTSQASFPGLRYAMVIRPNGRVMAHTDPAKVGLYFQDPVSQSLLEGGASPRLLVADRALIDTAHPILANGDLIAWARVGISQESITKGLDVITRDGIVYTLLAILVGTLFAFLMARGLTGGLLRLVKVADGIRAGRRDLRAPEDRADEIGSLSRNLNLMLNALAQREQDLRDARADVEQLATRDVLTNLPNRPLLMDRLHHAIVNARRDRHQVALLVIDIDRFKTINDSLGHHVGDQLIRQVADALRACVSEADTLARLGGDEFVIMLEGLDQPEDAGHLARRILAAVRRPFTIEDRVFNISCSIGIAFYPGDGADPQTLLQNADTAMYHAKENGRNTCEYFSMEMNAQVVRRLKLENELRNALIRNEFVLFYQPQVDMRSDTIVGVEALIRWQHPELGMVVPDAFIPIAEETGLIHEIGEWVLYEACRQHRRWCEAGLPPLRVAVNLSVRQVNTELVALVQRALRETGLDARYLDLEITESLLMHNLDESIAILRKIRDCGASISMDDFGTGYSSLSTLKRFPIQTLKIDRGFVLDLVQDSDDAEIVRAIMAMAHSLKLRVIAEGVENDQQLRFLRALECDEYQGYLFSKPIPPDSLRHLFDGNVRVDSAIS